MHTQIQSIDSQHPDETIIQQAAQIIQQGDLVAFPTETVYGLGADASNPEAVAKIFVAKQRPSNDPIIVHIADVEQLQEVVINPPPITTELVSRFFPGALTLILPKHPNIPLNVTSQQNTVAVRMPSHPIALALIRAAGVPIGAPSANRYSRPSPTTAQHVYTDLHGRIPFILDGGASTIGVESTIVDLTSKPPSILRPGGVTIEALQLYIPDIKYTPRYLAGDKAVKSPGTLLKHYSPDAEVRVFVGDRETIHETMHKHAETALEQGQKVGILGTTNQQSFSNNLTVQVLPLGKSYVEVANTLYAGLRQFDQMEIDLILVVAPQQIGLGTAIWDRLVRAAEGNVIYV